VSKNALMCLHDVVTHFKRQTDPFVDSAVSICLKRSSDANIFIVESADRTLEALCLHCSESKVILALTQQIKATKSQITKAKATRCLAVLVRFKGRAVVKIKDFPLLIKSLVQLTSEASADCRNFSRAGLVELVSAMGSENEVDKCVRKVVTDQEYAKLRGVYDKVTDFENYFDGVITLS